MTCVLNEENPALLRIPGNTLKSKSTNNRAEYAAKVVFASQLETLVIKYLTLLDPTAIETNDGPPTGFFPAAIAIVFISAYSFATRKVSRAAAIRERIDTNEYSTTLKGMRMKRGEPIVAPIPIAKTVPKPSIGFGPALLAGLRDFTLSDSGRRTERAIPESRQAMPPIRVTISL